MATLSALPTLSARKPRKKQCAKFTSIVKQEGQKIQNAIKLKNKDLQDQLNDPYKYRPASGPLAELNRRKLIEDTIRAKQQQLLSLTGKLFYHQSCSVQEEIVALQKQLGMGMMQESESKTINDAEQPQQKDENDSDNTFVVVETNSHHQQQQQQQQQKGNKKKRTQKIEPTNNNIELVPTTREAENEGTNKETSTIVADIDTCPTCLKILLHVPSQARLVCEGCGKSSPYLPYTNAGVPFGEDVEISQHAYERVKHFKTNLKQYSVDAPEIPDWVIEMVQRGYSRLHVKSVHEVRATPVKEVLKSLGLSEYRNMAARITNRMNGHRTALFQPEEIKELLQMFKEVQPIFPLVKGSSRRNFLNTNYLLNKFCRIKGWVNRASCFPLLKEVSVLREQDNCFRAVCKIKRWPFSLSI